MGFFSTLKQIWDDILLWLSCNKRKFLLIAALALCGLVLGVVVFVNCKQNWWYCNRCDQAELLLCGSFLSVLLSLALQTCFVVVLMLLSQIHKYLSFVRYLILFVGCLYAGANLACSFSVIGFIALFYLIFYTLLTVTILIVASLSFCCQTEYCKTLGEVWQDGKKQVLIVCLLSLVRFLLLFLLLRPLSGSI